MVMHLSHVDQEVFEQQPHVIARVDLFHLDFGVDVAVRQEGNVVVFQLRSISFILIIAYIHINIRKQLIAIHSENVL